MGPAMMAPSSYFGGVYVPSFDTTDLDLDSLPFTDLLQAKSPSPHMFTHGPILTVAPSSTVGMQHAHLLDAHQKRWCPDEPQSSSSNEACASGGPLTNSCATLSPTSSSWQDQVSTSSACSEGSLQLEDPVQVVRDLTLQLQQRTSGTNNFSEGTQQWLATALIVLYEMVRRSDVNLVAFVEAAGCEATVGLLANAWLPGKVREEALELLTSLIVFCDALHEKLLELGVFPCLCQQLTSTTTSVYCRQQAVMALAYLSTGRPELIPKLQYLPGVKDSVQEVLITASDLELRMVCETMLTYMGGNSSRMHTDSAGYH